MRRLIARLNKWWMGVNYSFCHTQAYLLSQQGRNVEAGEWLTRAGEWELKWWQAGRSLR